jgi:hypothetical protein
MDLLAIIECMKLVSLTIICSQGADVISAVSPVLDMTATCTSAPEVRMNCAY